MSGWRRSAAAGLLLLAIYVGLSFLNSPRGFLGTDTGGKVATMKVMTERGRFDPDLGYWAEEWDPDGSLHPIGYTSHTASGKWVNVTTLPALWVGWQLYRVGGYRASLLVPMAGAVAACFAGLALLRRLGVGERHAWHGFWLLGLASPLTIYALDFWEHTLGVALMAWAIVLLVDVVVRRRRTPLLGGALAGLLFGAAATMRTESLVYLAVAGLAAPLIYATFGSPGGSKRAQMAGGGVIGAAMAAGALLPLGLNELLERDVVGATVRASRVAGTALGFGQDASGRLREAMVTVLALEGTSVGIFFGVLLVAVLIYAASRRDTGVAVAAVVGGAGVVVVRFVIGGLGFVPGLGPAWMTAVAAAGGLGRRRRGRLAHAADADAAAAAARLVAAIAVVALPIVVATQFRGGAGPQWGGRYLLVSGFLLTVLGWAALTERPRPVRVGFASLAAGVTAMGLVWLAVRSHAVDGTIADLERRPEPVLVSDVYFLAREGGATYAVKRWLTLSPAPDARPADAANVLTDAGVDRFAAVALVGERPLMFPGFEPVDADHLRLFDGVDLRVTTWSRTG